MINLEGKKSIVLCHVNYFFMIVLQVHQNVEPQTERVDQCRRAVPEHCLPNVWDGFLLSRALSGGYRYLPGKTIVSADD